MSDPSITDIWQRLDIQSKRIAQLEIKALDSENAFNALAADNTELRARFKIMEAFFIKEFPKHFAGDAPLVFVTDQADSGVQGDEVLPEVQPVDLRTEEEKARGECYRLSDLVDMGSLAG